MTECEHLWALLARTQNRELMGDEWTTFGYLEVFFCQRDPSHRLCLIDGEPEAAFRERWQRDLKEWRVVTH